MAKRIYFVEHFKNMATNEIDLSLLYATFEEAKEDKSARLRDRLNPEYIIWVSTMNEDEMRQELLKIMAAPVVEGNDLDRDYETVKAGLDMFIDKALDDFDLIFRVLQFRKVKGELYMIFCEALYKFWEVE